MQVLCKQTNSNAEVHCSICGQGFLVYWAHTSRTERESARLAIVEGLAAHHGESNSPNVHPRTGFSISGWPGNSTLSAATTLFGDLLGWAV